jgi:2,5-diamino-6-(ribosylamino)-4(3H)-pyrimidinone 5'-phosphate reductase
MLPRVVLFNAVSLDGRIDGFALDIVQFYELASHWKEDATLAGADTILLSVEKEKVPEEDGRAFEPPQKNLDDHRALLVVPDSRGRVRCWHYLKTLPYWRGFISLCSRSTPQEHLDYLKKRHVDCIVAGEDHVDMRAALEVLNSRYGVKVVRVDSGGVLSGVLLRQGLVDEVSLLIYPSLVGGVRPRSIFRAPDLESPDGAIPLRLTHLEKMRSDLVWLRYEVVK